ncbi:MAG TPA: penicillin-binding transpeptidase domain-containing protein [Clostridia bacterium]|nr:penicillin-binding transpeptidase domain-containing protein [Clostridia bacterium]
MDISKLQLNLIRKAILIVLSFILSLTLLTGCDQIDPMDTATTYMDGWSNLNFEKMYETLSRESQLAIPKDAFVERYKTVLSAIELETIDLESDEVLIEEDKAYLPITAVFNTDTVDSFQSNFTLNLTLEEDEWRVVWDPSLIFPDLDGDDTVRITSQKAFRGTFNHRDDIPIVIDGEAYTVGAVPGKIPNREEFAKALAPLLELGEDKILDEMAKDWVTDDTLVPLRNLPLSIDEEFKNEILSVKGVMLVTNIVTDSRRYLDNELYSHIVGYVQRVGAEDLENNKHYRPNDLIGKQGLEASMEENLHGASGYTLFIRDKDGNNKSVIAEKPPQDGDTISLTLDHNLQQIVHDALQGNVGAVVALNPISGEVLAMSSYPDYNPNIFPNGVLNSQWEKLSQHPDKPFINRATYANYPPGSTFKPFTAAMALEEGIIDANTQVEAAQKTSWTPSLSNWNEPPITRTNHPQGPVNLDRALVWSDNIFFAWAALKLPPETFESYANRFGLGQSLPFSVPVSQSIIKRQEAPLAKRLLATSSYGQGEMLVTPIELASMFTAFVNGGDMVLPQIIQGIKSPNDEIIQTFERKLWQANAIPQKWVDTILPSLVNVVEDKTGTARSLAIEGLSIAAKTGTAEKDDMKQEVIAWLVACTLDTPDPLLLSIAIEVPSGGGGVRMDIARDILTEYYLLGEESLDEGSLDEGSLDEE